MHKQKQATGTNKKVAAGTNRVLPAQKTILKEKKRMKQCLLPLQFCRLILPAQAEELPQSLAAGADVAFGING